MQKRKRLFTLFLLVTAILLISWAMSAFMFDEAAVYPSQSIAPYTNINSGSQKIPVPAISITPRLTQAPDGGLSVDNNLPAGQINWHSIDVWSTTSGGQLPPKMNGTFVAVSNTIGGLDASNDDQIIYEPINVAYGTSGSNCVWFQFCVYFFANGGISMNIWALWDINGGGYTDDVITNNLAYTIGDTYNFALTTSGTNTVTFTVEDTNTGGSWSNNNWEVTVPGLNICFWPSPGYYSPASCVEGYTTNSQLTNVPNFLTTIGYGETTHFHSDSSGIPYRHWNTSFGRTNFLQLVYD